MEPVTLAASAVAFLSPYLAKVGTKAAEEVGKKLPEYAGKMWTTITDKFKGKEAAQEAVMDLLQQPEDSDNQVVFRKQLLKMLESDEDFAKFIETLLSHADDEVQSSGGDTIIVSGDGAAATGHGLAGGKGSVVVKGDVHGGINLNPSKPQD